MKSETEQLGLGADVGRQASLLRFVRRIKLKVDIQRCWRCGLKGRASGLKVIGGLDGGEGLDGEEVGNRCGTAGQLRPRTIVAESLQASILALLDCKAPMKCHSISEGS